MNKEHEHLWEHNEYITRFDSHCSFILSIISNVK